MALASEKSDGHLDFRKIPVVDLRYLSQDEINCAAQCSDEYSDLRFDDIVVPKIDRSIFNESAGSRKQTYSRLRFSQRSTEQQLGNVTRRRAGLLSVSRHSNGGGIQKIMRRNPNPGPENGCDLKDNNSKILQLLRQLFMKGEPEPEPSSACKSDEDQTVTLKDAPGSEVLDLPSLNSASGSNGSSNFTHDSDPDVKFVEEKGDHVASNAGDSLQLVESDPGMVAANEGGLRKNMREMPMLNGMSIEKVENKVFDASTGIRDARVQSVEKVKYKICNAATVIPDAPVQSTTTMLEMDRSKTVVEENLDRPKKKLRTKEDARRRGQAIAAAQEQQSVLQITAASATQYSAVGDSGPNDTESAAGAQINESAEDCSHIIKTDDANTLDMIVNNCSQSDQELAVMNNTGTQGSGDVTNNFVTQGSGDVVNNGASQGSGDVTNNGVSQGCGDVADNAVSQGSGDGADNAASQGSSDVANNAVSQGPSDVANNALSQGPVDVANNGVAQGSADAGDIGRPATQDPFVPQLKRKFQPLETETEVQDFFEKVGGEWASKRKKRKIVDAEEFGEGFPKGWKLLLGVRKKDGRFLIECRKYISPDGQQLASCREVSAYIVSTSGQSPAVGASQAPSCQSAECAHDVQIQTSSNPCNSTGQVEYKEGGYKQYSSGLNGSAFISNEEKETSQKTIATATAGIVEHNSKKDNDTPMKCSKCNVEFSNRSTFMAHLAVHHNHINKNTPKEKKASSAKSIADGVIIVDGKYECQICHKVFNERHRYTGHVGVHVRNAKKPPIPLDEISTAEPDADSNLHDVCSGKFMEEANFNNTVISVLEHCNQEEQNADLFSGAVPSSSLSLEDNDLSTSHGGHLLGVFDAASSKDDPDYGSRDQKIESLTGFEQFQMEYAPKFEFETGQDTNNEMDAQMELGLDLQQEMEWESVLAKIENSSQHFVCVWCNSVFSHDGLDNELQSGSVGFICPLCKTKIGQVTI